jgi:hypothetical protein
MTEFLKWLAGTGNHSATMEDIMFTGQDPEKIWGKFGEKPKKAS